MVAARRASNGEEARRRHEEIANLLGSLTIKSCGAFLEASPNWVCPSCRRSKVQIVAPGSNVDVVARIVRHHDHIENLIARILTRTTPVSAEKRQRLNELDAELCRRFCHFEAVDVCEACNNVDTTAKQLVRAPWWFSFSPRGIAHIIREPRPYAIKHEIDRVRLNESWDVATTKIEGLEARIRRAIDESSREAQHA